MYVFFYKFSVPLKKGSSVGCSILLRFLMKFIQKIRQLHLEQYVCLAYLFVVHKQI